ncbi:MAG: hypothetical protein WA629_15655 [Candidatus Aquilonibacter sp.]
MNGWGTWDSNWIWSFALIAITITIHAIGVVLIATAMQRLKEARRPNAFLASGIGTVVLIVGVASSLVIFHAIECIIWAVVYVHLGALSSPADAVLYSVDSMTTRGESGEHLERQWRLMGAAEAGDGMLLFGVSTAFLFYVMVRAWKSEFV